MNLPRRVQRELEAADAAQAEYQARHAEHTAQTVRNGTQLEAALAVPSEEVLPNIPDPVVTPPATPEPPKEDFEHKFKVLQGMYKADVTRTKQMVETLSAEIAELKTRPAKPAEAPQLNQADVEKFGADLIEMVKRYAEEQQQEVNRRLKALEQKVHGVATATAVNAEQSFFKELRGLVQDLDVVNADPRWLAWLGHTDEMFGMDRQEALNKAQAALDAPRVAKIVNMWKTSLPVVTPAPTMATHVTPSGAGNPPPSPPKPKPIISEKFVQDFYMDLTRGKYAGREADAQRIEIEINEAAAENRIR